MIPYNIKCSWLIWKVVGALGQGVTQVAQQLQAKMQFPLECHGKVPRPPVNAFQHGENALQSLKDAVTDILDKQQV